MHKTRLNTFVFEILFIGHPGGVMTLHDYGYLPPEFLKSYPVSEWNFQKYTPCLGVWLSVRGFFGGIYCYANFSIVFKPIFLEGGANSRGKLLEGKDSSQWNNVSKHRN